MPDSAAARNIFALFIAAIPFSDDVEKRDISVRARLRARLTIQFEDRMTRH